MKIIQKYRNGNVDVTLFSNGTRTMEYDDSIPVYFDYPTSIDIKITNKCNLKCPFCHESSREGGEHCDIKRLIKVLSSLPGGQELAIGGGDALSHPDINFFLDWAQEKHLISNVTINKRHLSVYSEKLLKWAIEGKIYGLGISIPYDDDMKWDKSIQWVGKYPNSVAHLIIGIHTQDDISILKEMGFNKFLLLGYKIFGRGKKYFESNSDKINNNILNWKTSILNILSKNGLIIAFDNLAVNQLALKEEIPPRLWEILYQGDDFTHSMYIDAVQEQYAPTSRTPRINRIHFSKMSLLKYFRDYSEQWNSGLEKITDSCDFGH
jgi:hypothetical protein